MRWRWVFLITPLLAHVEMIWMAFADDNPDGPALIFSLWFGSAFGLVYSAPWFAIYFICSLLIQTHRAKPDDNRGLYP